MDNMGSSQASLSRRSFIGGSTALAVLPLLPKSPKEYGAETSSFIIEYPKKENISVIKVNGKDVDWCNVDLRGDIYLTSFKYNTNVVATQIDLLQRFRKYNPQIKNVTCLTLIHPTKKNYVGIMCYGF